MKKKILYLILSFTIFTFIGCGSNTNSSNNVAPSKTLSIQSNNNTPASFTPLSLSDTSYTYCPFIFNNTDLVFPNPDENNRISISQEPLPKDILQSKDITDFADFSSYNIVLLNGILYFDNGSDKNSLSSLNISDKSYSKINNHSVHNLIGVEDQLYYLNKIDDNKLYRYDTNSKKIQNLSSDQVGSFIINGDFVIYENLSDESKLYSIKTDGTNREKLTNYASNSFIPFDGELLFLNSSDNNNLYSLNPTTLESRRLSIINGFQLKSINNSLYFINGNDSNSLYSMSVDLQQSKIDIKPEISDSINNYYLTQLGIFYEKSINVNNIYFKSFPSQS